MSQANLDHNLKFCFLQIYFNVIIQYTPLWKKLYFPTRMAGVFPDLASRDSFACMGKYIILKLSKWRWCNNEEDGKCPKVRDISVTQKFICGFLSAFYLAYISFILCYYKSWFHSRDGRITSSEIRAVKISRLVRTFRRNLLSLLLP
jgi:hypothetical protein